MLRLFSSLCLGVLLLLCFILRLEAADVTGVTDTEIKLGNHSHQSGPYGASGMILRTAKAYFGMINEKGGIFDRKINLLIGDSANNPQQALQFIKKQVEQDKVFAIVGAHGNPHLSVYRYLRQQKVPDLWVMDQIAEFGKPVHPNTFQFRQPTDLAAEYYADYIAKRWPGKVVGILHPNQVHGKTGTESFKTSNKGRNNIVVEEVDVRIDPSAKAQILNFKKAGVEVIYAFVSTPITPAAMKFAVEQNFRPQWLLGDTNANRNFIDLAGKEIVEGAISNQMFYSEVDTHIPAVGEHLDFMKKYLPNEKPSLLSIQGQVLAELTVENLKRAGKNLSREGVLKAAESFKDWKCGMCRGTSSISPDNHVIFTGMYLLRASNGKWVDLQE